MNNLDKLESIFPECITESTGADGKIVRAVDFDRLKQILSGVIADEHETYQFTFVGKNKAAQSVNNAATGKTLRPRRDTSRDFDTTRNLYVEGENLIALRLLLESYRGKVKTAYIDPPYNTGNDFIYCDDFSMTQADFDDAAGNLDDEGNVLRTRLNTPANPRVHSDWCAMIYSRLLLAKQFLSDDGVIFISIDDHEQATLKLMCDEIFGEKNFVAQLVWEKKKKGAFLSNTVTNVKEYVLVYCKSINSFGGLIGEINRSTETYPCVKTTNPRGVRIIPSGTPSRYREENYRIAANTRIGDGNTEMIFLDDAVIENGILQTSPRVESNWIYQQASINEYARRGELFITGGLNLRRVVSEPRMKMLKDLLLRVGSDGESEKVFTYDENLNHGGWGTNEDANEELHQIFGVQYIFDFAKPSRLIGKLIQSATDADSIVMDFFSGSATTAQAVMELNAQDGGQRKFIMIQLDEPTPDNSEARRAGYETICEIGEERIRRAGDKLKAVHPDIDTGFRVFKVDSSNFKSPPKNWAQEILLGFVDNIKDDRDAYDLLFGALLTKGLPIDLPCAAETVEGVNVLSYDGGRILACFERALPDDVIKSLAARKPERIFFRDACFASSADKINATEYFKYNASDTGVEIL